MTPEQARIVLLEKALEQAYNKIGFMHGCLTDPKMHSYAYPEQTVSFLSEVERLIKIREYCVHSRFEYGCESCKAGSVRREMIREAKKVLGDENETQE